MKIRLLVLWGVLVLLLASVPGKVKCAFETAGDGEPPGIPIPMPEVPPSDSIIRDFQADYLSNAHFWTVQSDLQNGVLNYGDRTYTLADIPQFLLGAEWIRPANQSKQYLFNKLSSFKLAADADVYLAHSDAVKQKPEWLTTMGWADSGMNCSNTDGEVFTLYVKRYLAGETAKLGYNGGDHCCYFVIVKPVDGPARSGIISDFVCFDNAGFEIVSNAQAGLRCYTDRPYTFTSMAATIQGCDFVRPPNSAKVSRKDPLIAFRVAVDAEIYVAHVSDIAPKPPWLTSGYERTGETITNDDPMPKTYELFKRTERAGASITMGPNGNRERATYIVFVRPSQEKLD
jgi:hypothetical protein